MKQFFKKMVQNKQTWFENYEKGIIPTSNQQTAFNLRILTLYECDLELVKLIWNVSRHSLEKLNVAMYYQPQYTSQQTEDFDELQKLIVGVKGRSYREGIYTVDGQVVREDVLAVKAREGMSVLKKLNICSTWYTLKLPKVAVDDQND